MKNSTSNKCTTCDLIQKKITCDKNELLLVSYSTPTFNFRLRPFFFKMLDFCFLKKNIFPLPYLHIISPLKPRRPNL